MGENISKALTNNPRLIAAMKKTGEHKKNFKPDGVNSIAVLAARKGANQCRITKEQRGSIVPKSMLPACKLYEREVWKITAMQPLHMLPHIEKRGNHAFDQTAWHLDHKFSIAQGFLDGISPEIIGNIRNLEMLPWLENVKKGMKCSISLCELI